MVKAVEPSDVVLASLLRTLFSYLSQINYRNKNLSEEVSELVNLEAVFEAESLNLLPSEVMNFPFPGILVEESKDFYLHLNENCSVLKTRHPFLNDDAFGSETKTVTLKTLPSLFTNCLKCNSFNIASTVKAVSADLIILKSVFKNSSLEDFEPFDFYNSGFSGLKYYTDQENNFLQKRAFFDEVLETVTCVDKKNNFLDFIKIFDELVFEKFQEEAKEACESFNFNVWLDSKFQKSYLTFAKNKFLLASDFDDSLILACYSFLEENFEPEISVSSSYVYADKDKALQKSVSILNKIIGDSFGNNSDSFHYPLDTILSCLLNTFKVHVSADKKEYFVVMPRTLHEFTVAYVMQMNQISEALPHKTEVFSISSTLIDSYTEEIIDTFVSLWDVNSTDSFASTWEVASTI